MEFSTLHQELQNSTEMIHALLAGVEPEAARLKPSAESWSILDRKNSLSNVKNHLYGSKGYGIHIRQLVELRRIRREDITKPYNLEYARDG